MNLTINRTKYDLTFGIEFLREIDKRHGHEENNMKFGMGLALIAPKLIMNDLVALFDLIQAATKTERSQPSREEIEDFLAAEETDLEALSKLFQNAFETSPMVQKAMKNIGETFKNLQEKALGNLQKPTEEKPAEKPTSDSSETV